MIRALNWLECRGQERVMAVREAAHILLDAYRRGREDPEPVDLARLADSLHVRIRRVAALGDIAHIVPVGDGFEIVVGTGASWARLRMSIAHELVHTLFYHREGGYVRRLVPASDIERQAREEAFCFDVGRVLLVPPWHLERSGIASMTDPAEALTALCRRFRVSAHIGARLLLQDYRLMDGIAGEWEVVQGRWEVKPGCLYSDPIMSKSHRALLAVWSRKLLEAGWSTARGSTHLGWAQVRMDAELAHHFLSRIPGVGTTRARNIADRVGGRPDYSSPPTPTQLGVIPGIGEGRARAIAAALREVIALDYSVRAGAEGTSAFILARSSSGQGL